MSIAARGEPAVPLVNMSTARSVGSRSTVGGGLVAGQLGQALGIDDVLQHRDLGPVQLGDHGEPGGPQTTARAPTAASSLTSSGPGLPGLRGTATNPPRAAASQPRTNSTVLGATMPMRSPTSRPRSAKPACTPATSRRSSP